MNRSLPVLGILLAGALIVLSQTFFIVDQRKQAVVVRLGERAGQRLYLLSGFAAAALCLGLWGDGRTWAALLPLLYLPPHVAAWRRMVRIGRGRELNTVLGATSRNILLFGLLLTLGLLL